jgi:hypothetical protein
MEKRLTTFVHMKALPLFCFLTLAVTTSFAQTETFDLATYSAPTSWSKSTANKGVVSFTTSNSKNGSYCQIGIYASTATNGTIQLDFENEWRDLVVKTYKPSAKPELLDGTAQNGWHAQIGVAPFAFNGAQSSVMLINMSGHGRNMSFVILTNSPDYQSAIDLFLKSVEMKKFETVNESHPIAPATTNNTPGNTFKYNTTSFDDGWINSIHDDWVQVAKGQTTVLLHYPTNKIDLSSADYATIGLNAWNTLIAPRYRNMENFFQFRGSLDSQRPYFIAADVIDQISGRKSYVILFKKGDSGWIEVISTNKASFVQMYGVDINVVDYYADSGIWEPLLKMPGYNKFAVGASDLKGKWSNKFSGFTQYVNAFTGADVGMNASSSAEAFEFTGATYKWDIKAASGMVGNMKFQGAKSQGSFSSVSDWQISFTDIEGKPKTYNVYFSCVKGARILWMEDSVYRTGYSGFGKSE